MKKLIKKLTTISRTRLNRYTRAIGVLMSGNTEGIAQQTRNLPLDSFGDAQSKALLKDCQTLRSVSEGSAFELIKELLSLGVLGYSSVEEKGRHFKQNHPVFNHPSLWVRDCSLPIVNPTLIDILFQRIGCVKALQKHYAWTNEKKEVVEPKFKDAIKASMFGGNANSLDNFFGYVYQFQKLSKEELVEAFNLVDVPQERIDALYDKIGHFAEPEFLEQENFRAVRNQLVAMFASWMTKNLEVIEDILAIKQVQTAQSKQAYKDAKKAKKSPPAPVYDEVAVHQPIAIPPRAPEHILERRASTFNWEQFVAKIEQYNASLVLAKEGLSALRDNGTPLSQEAISAVGQLRIIGDEMLAQFGIINGELKVEVRRLMEESVAPTKIDKVIKAHPELAQLPIPSIVGRFSREIEKYDEQARRLAQNAEYEQAKADVLAQTAHLDLDQLVWNAERLDGFIYELLQLPDAYKGIVIKHLGGSVVRMADLQSKAFGRTLYFNRNRIVKQIEIDGALHYVYFDDGKPYFFANQKLVVGNDVNDRIVHPIFANEKKAQKQGIFDRKQHTEEFGRWFKHERSTSKFEPFPILSFVVPAKALLEELLAKASSESVGTEGKVLKIIATQKSYLLEDAQERHKLCQLASNLSKASSLYQYTDKQAFTFREGHVHFYQVGGQLGIAIKTKASLATPLPEGIVICNSTGERIDTKRVTNFACYPFAKMHPSYLEPVNALLLGDKRVQAKGFTVVMENMDTPYQRVLAQVPFIDQRINRMNLHFKHLIGIDVNMHNIAFAVIDPSQSDENGNPVVVDSGLIDCQAASQFQKAGARYKRKKQMANALHANQQTKPMNRHHHEALKGANVGLMVGHILRLMYEYQALPIFEVGIGALQKGKQMEALWNDVVSAFTGDGLDADKKRRNDMLGVALSAVNFNFFPNLPGAGQWMKDKNGREFWGKCKLKPGMTTRHEFTSQRCIHCEIATTEQIQFADDIVVVDDHNVTLRFREGSDVSVYFETKLGKLASKELEPLRAELKKLAKKQMRTKFTETESTDSRYARFRCFNRGCDHNFVDSGHVEHADIGAAINIARNGYQDLMTPFKVKGE